jgi:hypothetical protein
VRGIFEIDAERIQGAYLPWMQVVEPSDIKIKQPEFHTVGAKVVCFDVFAHRIVSSRWVVHLCDGA